MPIDLDLVIDTWQVLASLGKNPKKGSNPLQTQAHKYSKQMWLGVSNKEAIRPPIFGAAEDAFFDQ